MASMSLALLFFSAVQAAPPAPAATSQVTPSPAAPSTTPPAAAAVPENSVTEPVGVSEYRIGSGDVLQVSVWREPEASIQSVVVRPDGKVTVPLIKEIYVLGSTPTELQKVLSAKLAQYIHGADVTVVVREIHSKKVYLVGAVAKTGTIPLLSAMTVLQVLAEAGGLT
jgi:polysaccharide export outer membrane protein